MFDYLDHPRYRALLSAVKAAPRDNLPRLVLADWLDEHGQEERAHTIRHQIAYRSPGWTRRRDHHGAAGRWRADRLAPAERGFADDRYPGLDLSTLTISRGFVSIVQCGYDEWVEHGWAIVADHPVRRVQPKGMVPYPAGYSGMAWLRGSEGLGGEFAGRGELPPDLFDCLPGSRTHRRRLDDDHNEHEVRCFPSWDSAESALTLACLAYAQGSSLVTAAGTV